MSEKYDIRDEDKEFYRVRQLQELVEMGPELLDLKEDDPELYQELDEQMDGALTDFEDWYGEVRQATDDAVENYEEAMDAIDSARGVLRGWI